MVIQSFIFKELETRKFIFKGLATQKFDFLRAYHKLILIQGVRSSEIIFKKGKN